MTHCNFCEIGYPVKDDFSDYYKPSHMTAFIADMKIADLEHAKNLLMITIDLLNTKLEPDHHILPWEITFKIKYCPFCGKELDKNR